MSGNRVASTVHAPLTYITGIGERVCAKLAKLGLHTIEDILYHLPLRYEDHRHIVSISQLRPGESALFCGRIVSSGEVGSRRGRTIYEVIIADDSGRIMLKWFHYRRDWMEKNYRSGLQVLGTGEVKQFGGRREIIHPEIEFFCGSEPPARQLAIVPVYPLTEGVSQRQMRKFCQTAAQLYSRLVVSHLPDEIAARQQLMALNEALLRIHCPPDDSDITILATNRDPARRTLIFDELFYLQLGLALRRKGVALQQGTAFAVNHVYTRPLVKMLPFQLTAAQKRVLTEIKTDMMAPRPMNRLLQGDVGSGKTIVALLAALIAIENHAQAAVVAPTEILAEQHFAQFEMWLQRLGLRAALLTGSTTTAERTQMLAALADGEIHLLVGTHAVLQDDVQFKRLGLGIVDEQHRFGVQQRNALRKKGDNPDILVMTATPIPRTLSLTVYGDLALSVIDELPAGRSPIKTRVIDNRKRPELIKFIRRELDRGRQGYAVYPLVEESDKSDLTAASAALETLRAELGGSYRLELLHGRMASREKEAIMQRFKAHDIDLLVATTVVEVGIDVPNATLMVIEHAERFGLAQLHQLRGRVGRGSAQSFCILVHSEQCGRDGRQRLQVIENSSDGFVIAEADLRQRGPGEFLGTRQAGMATFRVADILRDAHLLEQARKEAFAFIDQADIFHDAAYTELRHALMVRWGQRLELASVG